jgi:hypothetical protein
MPLACLVCRRPVNFMMTCPDCEGSYYCSPECRTKDANVLGHGKVCPGRDRVAKAKVESEIQFANSLAESLLMQLSESDDNAPERAALAKMHADCASRYVDANGDVFDRVRKMLQKTPGTVVDGLAKYKAKNRREHVDLHPDDMLPLRETRDYLLKQLGGQMATYAALGKGIQTPAGLALALNTEQLRLNDMARKMGVMDDPDDMPTAMNPDGTVVTPLTDPVFMQVPGLPEVIVELFRLGRKVTEDMQFVEDVADAAEGRAEANGTGARAPSATGSRRLNDDFYGSSSNTNPIGDGRVQNEDYRARRRRRNSASLVPPPPESIGRDSKTRAEETLKALTKSFIGSIGQTLVSVLGWTQEIATACVTNGFNIELSERLIAYLIGSNRVVGEFNKQVDRIFEEYPVADGALGRTNASERIDLINAELYLIDKGKPFIWLVTVGVNIMVMMLQYSIIVYGLAAVPGLLAGLLPASFTDTVKGWFQPATDWPPYGPYVEPPVAPPESESHWITALIKASVIAPSQTLKQPDEIVLSVFASTAADPGAFKNICANFNKRGNLTLPSTFQGGQKITNNTQVNLAMAGYDALNIAASLAQTTGRFNTIVSMVGGGSRDIGVPPLILEHTGFNFSQAFTTDNPVLAWYSQMYFYHTDQTMYHNERAKLMLTTGFPASQLRPNDAAIAALKWKAFFLMKCKTSWQRFLCQLTSMLGDGTLFSPSRNNDPFMYRLMNRSSTMLGSIKDYLDSTFSSEFGAPLSQNHAGLTSAQTKASLLRGVARIHNNGVNLGIAALLTVVSVATYTYASETTIGGGFSSVLMSASAVTMGLLTNSPVANLLRASSVIDPWTAFVLTLTQFGSEHGYKSGPWILVGLTHTMKSFGTFFGVDMTLGGMTTMMSAALAVVWKFGGQSFHKAKELTAITAAVVKNPNKMTKTSGLGTLIASIAFMLYIFALTWNEVGQTTIDVEREPFQ